MNTPRIIAAIALSAMLVTSTPTARANDQVVIPEYFRQLVETEGWSQQWHDALYGPDHDPAIAAALRKMLRAKRDAAALKSGLVAHEWGSMKHHVGSNTSEFDLMSEDRSDLPSFVKVWSGTVQLEGFIVEKPILYFYTDKPQKVNVNVGYPEGLLTQWYPDVTSFAPQQIKRKKSEKSHPMPRNGTLSWQQVELNPDFAPSLFAGVNENHPWWHIVRDTDATPLRTVDARRRQAFERFLFYRGAGAYKPMVTPKRSEAGDAFSVTVPFSQIDLRGVFLVRVNDSGATITHAPLLRATKTLTLAGPKAVKPIGQAADLAKAQLTESLEAAGLFPKEAAGLVKIWGDDMFTTPGERLLYLMPSNEVERVLPLTIDPEPSQTVRALIAWVELATPEAEQRVMDLVEQLGSQDPAQRAKANKELRELDRFAEAILRRTLETTADASDRQEAAVLQQIKQILRGLEQRRMQGNR
eukprot:g12820.t1